MLNRILFFLLISTAAQAQTLSPFPVKNCETICSTDEILKDSNGNKFIKIHLYVSLPAQNYTSTQEIIDLLSDFDSWDEYVTDSKNVRFESSENLGDIEVNGKYFYRHKASYEMMVKVVGIPTWHKTKEIAIYERINPINGALYSVKFYEDLTYPDRKGLKSKTGEIHLAYDSEKDVYRFYVIVNITPDVDSFLKLASDSIKKGMTDIFTGMFSL